MKIDNEEERAKKEPFQAPSSKRYTTTHERVRIYALKLNFVLFVCSFVHICMVFHCHCFRLGRHLHRHHHCRNRRTNSELFFNAILFKETMEKN